MSFKVKNYHRILNDVGLATALLMDAFLLGTFVFVLFIQSKFKIDFKMGKFSCFLFETLEAIFGFVLEIHGCDYNADCTITNIHFK